MAVNKQKDRTVSIDPETHDILIEESLDSRSTRGRKYFIKELIAHAVRNTYRSKK